MLLDDDRFFLRAMESPEYTPFKKKDLETAIPDDSLRNLQIECWSKNKDARPSITVVVNKLGQILGYQTDNDCSKATVPSPDFALPTPPETSSDEGSSMLEMSSSIYS